MRKVIAAINMTLDGNCDHMSMIADEEIHNHYTRLLNNAGTILYGRITFQLMDSYWPAILEEPTGIEATDEFAVAIDQIPKIVFSRSLENVGWHTASLAADGLHEEVTELKQQEGKDILVGSRSLIIALLNMGLIDEFQLCIHPTITGGRTMPLFEEISENINLKLLRTKIFGCGAVLHYYAITK